MQGPFNISNHSAQAFDELKVKFRKGAARVNNGIPWASLLHCWGIRQSVVRRIEDADPTEDLFPVSMGVLGHVVLGDSDDNWSIAALSDKNLAHSFVKFSELCRQAGSQLPSEIAETSIADGVTRWLTFLWQCAPPDIQNPIVHANDSRVLLIWENPFLISADAIEAQGLDLPTKGEAKRTIRRNQGGQARKQIVPDYQFEAYMADRERFLESGVKDWRKELSKKYGFRMSDFQTIDNRFTRRARRIAETDK